VNRVPFSAIISSSVSVILLTEFVKYKIVLHNVKSGFVPTLPCFLPAPHSIYVNAYGFEGERIVCIYVNLLWNERNEEKWSYNE